MPQEARGKPHIPKLDLRAGRNNEVCIRRAGYFQDDMHAHSISFHRVAYGLSESDSSKKTAQRASDRRGDSERKEEREHVSTG